MDEVEVSLKITSQAIYGYISLSGLKISRIRISYSLEERHIAISSWFTELAFKGMGFGKILLSTAVKQIEEFMEGISSVSYIWNGVNEYVHDWIVNRFNAVCECPISVLKATDKDSWDCHEYVLDVNRFMNYVSLISSVQNIKLEYGV